MRKCLPILAVVLVGMIGCQKLNVEKTVDLKMASTHRLEFTSPSYNQDVRVTVEPETCSVSAYLVKASDADAAEKVVAPGKAPPSNMVIAGKTFQRNDSRQDFIIETTIPAKTPYVLLLCGGSKSTRVKVKVVAR